MSRPRSSFSQRFLRKNSYVCAETSRRRDRQPKDTARVVIRAFDEVQRDVLRVVFALDVVCNELFAKDLLDHLLEGFTPVWHERIEVSLDRCSRPGTGSHPPMWMICPGR